MKYLKISTQIIGMVILMTVLLVIVGLLGLSGMQRTNAALQSVYAGRVVPLSELSGQNAALVEQMAAALGWKNQAQDLVQAVSVFKLQSGQGTVPRQLGAAQAEPSAGLSIRPSPAVSRLPHPRPALGQSALASRPGAAVSKAVPAVPVKVPEAPRTSPSGLAYADDDWQTF